MEFTAGGHSYRTTAKLAAIPQFHVSRRLVPVLKGIGGVADMVLSARRASGGGSPQDVMGGLLQSNSVKELFEAGGPLLDAFAALSDADAEYVINTCLGVVARDAGNGRGWAPVFAEGGGLMFNDIDMPTMLMIVFKVLQENLSGFFSMLPSGSKEPAGDQALS